MDWKCGVVLDSVGKGSKDQAIEITAYDCTLNEALGYFMPIIDRLYVGSAKSIHIYRALKGGSEDDNL